VFRQSPTSGVDPLPLGGRSASIPGVVSGSSSFGHPPGPFYMSYGWPHPYSQQGQVPHPPFPPGFQPNHPGHFMPPGMAAHGPYMHSPRPSGAQGGASSPSQDSASPGSERRGRGYGHAYSISLSVAAGSMPSSHRTRAAAVMAWNHPEYATPGNSKRRRKRTRSLPGDEETSGKSIQSGPDTRSTKTTSNKKSSATQTTPYDLGFVPLQPGAEIPPIGTTGQMPPAAWIHPRAALTPYPTPQRSTPVTSYYGQPPPFFPGFEQPHGPFSETRPPVRSYSAPLPGRSTDATHTHNHTHDSDSSEPSMAEHYRPPVSSRKTRRTAPDHDEAIIEPLPAALPQPQSLPQLPIVHEEPMASARPARRRSSLSRNRRSSPYGDRDGQISAAPPAAGVAAPGGEGLEWFQGQLLLESSEDESEQQEDKSTPYPV